jgi:transcriptional regulator with XRE-family HTH domain
MNQEINRIAVRSKILGVLLRDARLKAHRSSEECAAALGLDLQRYEDFESGEKSPSLPELELIAVYLTIPLDHFWGRSLALSQPTGLGDLDIAAMLSVRQKVIGAKIKKARLESKLVLEELASAVGIGVAELEACEYGEHALTVPQLEAICVQLNLPIQSITASLGTPSGRDGRQKKQQGLDELSPELLEFISKPVNRPYLELAHRLSEMSVEKLRAVGEGILEITL